MTEEQIRADQAAMLLKNSIINDAFKELQASIDRQRAGTGWNETKKREHLFLKERLLVELRVEFENFIARGEVPEPKKSIRERIVEKWSGNWPLRINQ